VGDLADRLPWASVALYEAILAGQWILERMVLRRHVGSLRFPAMAPVYWLLLQIPLVRAGKDADLGLALPLLGVAVAVAGGALRLWALGNLSCGFSYRTAPVEGSRLVKTGPYRFIRHPLYAGAFVLLAGALLLLRDYRGWLGALLIVGLSIARRIRREERAMRERHGAEFEAWRARTKLVVPGLL
jgi:protein-S-isoprenylcysteine O-methyltransferase Ste14